MSSIGFDTSNYTTSIAHYDGTDGINCSKLLPVRQGELGLRQSDAVFAQRHAGAIRQAVFPCRHRPCYLCRCIHATKGC